MHTAGIHCGVIADIAGNGFIAVSTGPCAAQNIAAATNGIVILLAAVAGGEAPGVLRVYRIERAGRIGETSSLVGTAYAALRRSAGSAHIGSRGPRTPCAVRDAGVHISFELRTFSRRIERLARQCHFVPQTTGVAVTRNLILIGTALRSIAGAVVRIPLAHRRHGADLLIAVIHVAGVGDAAAVLEAGIV